MEARQNGYTMIKLGVRYILMRETAVLQKYESSLGWIDLIQQSMNAMLKLNSTNAMQRSCIAVVYSLVIMATCHYYV